MDQAACGGIGLGSKDRAATISMQQLNGPDYQLVHRTTCLLLRSQRPGPSQHSIVWPCWWHLLVRASLPQRLSDPTGLSRARQFRRACCLPTGGDGLRVLHRGLPDGQPQEARAAGPDRAPATGAPLTAFFLRTSCRQRSDPSAPLLANLTLPVMTFFQFRSFYRAFDQCQMPWGCLSSRSLVTGVAQGESCQTEGQSASCGNTFVMASAGGSNLRHGGSDCR